MVSQHAWVVFTFLSWKETWMNIICIKHIPMYYTLNTMRKLIKMQQNLLHNEKQSIQLFITVSFVFFFMFMFMFLIYDFFFCSKDNEEKKCEQ